MCRAGIFRFADPPMKCLPGRDISCKVRRRYSEERASEAPVATVNCPMNVCQVAPDMRRIVNFGAIMLALNFCAVMLAPNGNSRIVNFCVIMLTLNFCATMLVSNSNFRIVKFLCNNVGLERQLPLSIWKEGSREAVVHMRNKNREGQRLGLAQDTQEERTS